MALLGPAAAISPIALNPALTGIPLQGSPVAAGLFVGLLALNVVLAIWYLVELGFLRGTVGPNRYGPGPGWAPKRGVTAGSAA